MSERGQKTTLYLETSVVSYLVARPSRDLIVAARQEITREWWERRRRDYEVYTSAVVLDEVSRGDPSFARRRLDALAGIPLLPKHDEVVSLADALRTEGPFPEAAVTDAVHLALAAVYEIDILLTWNCRHLANPDLAAPVRSFLSLRNYMVPVICTPGEMTE